MASMKRSKPQSKADLDKSIMKQSNQLKKEQEARLISQDEEMKFMINSLIKTSKMKQNKIKDSIRPTLLKMVAEIDKKTSTINTYLQKTAEVGVAANSKDIDSSILDQKTRSKSVIVRYKKNNMNAEPMYSERLLSPEYRRILSPKPKYIPLPRSPLRQIQKTTGIKLKSKHSRTLLLDTQTHQSPTDSPTTIQQNLQNYRHPLLKRQQHQSTSSQPQVALAKSRNAKPEFVPKSAQQLIPNVKQLQRQSYMQKRTQKPGGQSPNPKQKQVTGAKGKTDLSTKRLSKQMYVHTVVKM